MKWDFAYSVSKRAKRETLSPGSALPAVTGKTPPRRTPPFCRAGFLLEFILLASLSTYLAFPYAAKRGGFCGPGHFARSISSSRRLLQGHQDPLSGSAGDPGCGQAAEASTVPSGGQPVLKAHSGGQAVPVEAAGALGLSLG